MSIIKNGKEIWITKKAHDFLVSKKRIPEEPMWKVVDIILEIPKEEK